MLQTILHVTDMFLNLFLLEIKKKINKEMSIIHYSGLCIGLHYATLLHLS